MINLDWSDVKFFIDNKSLIPQYVETDEIYTIFIFDGEMQVKATIEKLSTDATEFETSYKDKSNKSLSPRTSLQNATIVSQSPLEGSSFVEVTHDWCDSTTWYQESVQVTDETLTLDTGTTYKAVNTTFIDLENGKLYDEENVNAAASGKYTVVVKIDDVIQTSGYTVDYNNGKVTFDSAPGGVVKCSYCYPNGSTYTLIPDVGKLIIIKHTELQFTVDMQVTSPVDFEIWGYDPENLPNKKMYGIITYKNVKDLIASGNLGTGVIKACDILTKDVIVFPWNYLTAKPFESSVGAELRMKIRDDNELPGEWGCAALYCLARDE